MSVFTFHRRLLSDSKASGRGCRELLHLHAEGFRLQGRVIVAGGNRCEGFQFAIIRVGHVRSGGGVLGEKGARVRTGQDCIRPEYR